MLSRVELFESAVFVCTCRRTKTELFKNVDVKLSVPSHPAQYYKLIQDAGQAFTSVFLILGLISNLIACFQANLVLYNHCSQFLWRQEDIPRESEVHLLFTMQFTSFITWTPSI